MKSTPSSGRRRSTAIAVSWSGGGPQMPLPVMRIAPKPRRWTSRSPPILKVPEAVAVAIPTTVARRAPRRRALRGAARGARLHGDGLAVELLAQDGEDLVARQVGEGGGGNVRRGERQRPGAGVGHGLGSLIAG